MSSPAVAKLLAEANEMLAMARDFQSQDRMHDATLCAVFANEYVRAARAIQDVDPHLKHITGRPLGWEWMRHE